MRNWIITPVLLLILLNSFPDTALCWPHEGDEVHPGIIYRRISGDVEIPGSGVWPQEIYILYVDMENPAISFVANKQGDRNITTSQFAARYGVKAAINTNFGSGGEAPCGMAMGEGEIWTNAYHHVPGGKCSDSAGFTELGDISFFDSWDTLHGPAPEGVTNIFTGMPTLVLGGAIMEESTINHTDYPSHMAYANPRTGVCLHEDNRTVVMIVVDGRATGRTGMRGITFARFMKHNLGCRHGVNLDGGGSSTMFVEGRPGHGGRPAGVVNQTSDGHERVVCCHVGVRVDPDAKWYAAEYVDQSDYPTVEAGDVFELWVSYRNIGRRPWPHEGASRVLLGADDPEDRESVFFLEGEWVSETRAASLDAVLNPGDTGTFTFSSLAPADEGVYTEAFTPVVEGVGWMRPTLMFWDITVNPGPEEDDGPDKIEEADAADAAAADGDMPDVEDGWADFEGDPAGDPLEGDPDNNGAGLGAACGCFMAR